ncbi:MAG: hypothetical protein HZC16_03245 [Candidatus Omnitrophica bacterium]|nr:hypothetical protein [Candidatus Omnitrophota bacterium]
MRDKISMKKLPGDSGSKAYDGRPNEVAKQLPEKSISAETPLGAIFSSVARENYMRRISLRMIFFNNDQSKKTELVRMSS